MRHDFCRSVIIEETEPKQTKFLKFQNQTLGQRLTAGKRVSPFRAKREISCFVAGPHETFGRRGRGASNTLGGRYFRHL